MHLTARLHPLCNKSRDIVERLVPVKSGRITSDRYPVPVDDKILMKILQEADSAEGYWVSGETVFTKGELRDVSHFEAVCRKYVSESPVDYEHNANVVQKTSVVWAGAEKPIRLPFGFALTRIKMRPHMVAAIGDWTEEYVIGSAVVQAFEQAKLTGWSMKPVLNPKMQSHHTDFVQIYSDAVLDAALFDCSVERLKSEWTEENGHLRHLGCLAYPASALEHKLDFARTAEPWGGGHGQLSWVVSSRVVEVFVKNKLRGWAFRPVMLEGSGLYRQYIELWKALCSAVSESKKSKFDGGRW